MKLIAKDVMPMFLIELTDEEATDVEMANEDMGDDPIEIVRCEGADNKPRVWITGIADLESLVDMLDQDVDPAIIGEIKKSKG